MPVPSARLVEIALRRLVKLSRTVSLAHMARATGDTAEALGRFADGVANLEQLRAGLVAAAHETAPIEVAAMLQVAVEVMNKELAARRGGTGGKSAGHLDRTRRRCPATNRALFAAPFSFRLPLMFMLNENETALIQAAWESGGEFAAAVELRRLFPGISDMDNARRCARIVAGWRPPASAEPKAY